MCVHVQVRTYLRTYVSWLLALGRVAIVNDYENERMYIQAEYAHRYTQGGAFNFDVGYNFAVLKTGRRRGRRPVISAARN